MHNLLKTKKIEDDRGSFEKLYQSASLSFKQVFITESLPDVFRGFHFYSKSNRSNRVLNVLEGEITDILIDLRSEYFGNISTIEMSSTANSTVLIPDYCAHGFISKTNVKLLYLFEKVHIHEFDEVFNYSSFGELSFLESCIISERDKNSPELSDAFAF